MLSAKQGAIQKSIAEPAMVKSDCVNVIGPTDCTVLPYSRGRGILPRRSYLLGLVTLPALYVLVYVLLRLAGVYYPFYHQGGWEMDGGTGVYAIDLAFLPATITEIDCQNRLRWLREPTGG